MAERKLGIAFIRDVTEQWLARKQAERQNFDLEIKVQQRTAALRQAERRLIAAINSASEGFAAFDWTGKLLFANEQIWAAAPVSLWCRRGHEPHRVPAVLRHVRGRRPAAASTLRSPFEETRVRPADEEGYVGAALRDEGRWRHDLRAPDRHHRLQAGGEGARNRRSTRERETTNAYRSFVSMVSHQFRTPLAILDSSAQRILRRGQAMTQDELVTRVQKIRNAANRLTRLVDSVLNAAKLDAGTIELNPASYNLVDLVMDICERQREVSRTGRYPFRGSGSVRSAFTATAC